MFNTYRTLISGHFSSDFHHTLPAEKFPIPLHPLEGNPLTLRTIWKTLPTFLNLPHFQKYAIYRTPGPVSMCQPIHIPHANYITHPAIYISLIPNSIHIIVDREGPSTPLKYYPSLLSPNTPLVWNNQLPYQLRIHK